MARKTRRKLWIERDYKSFMRRKQGQKLIKIFGILARSISTIEEIRLNRLLEERNLQASKSC